MIKFKTERIEQEWRSGNLNEKIYDIINVLEMVTQHVFNKPIVVTDIYRTQEENDRIYGWVKGGKKKRKYSVHTYWRGIDIRTNIYDEKEIKTLVRILSHIVYDEKRPRIKTAKYGDSLHLDHIHIQVK